MKHFLPLAITAAACTLTFTACDKEKVEDAKVKTEAAAQSVGELAKDTTGKVVDKTKEGAKTLIEKAKSLKENLKTNGGPALEKFKAHLGGFSEMMKGMKGQAGDNPAKAKEMMNQLMAKLGTISTDGVPTDLGTAFHDYHVAMRRILTLSQSVPADPAAAEKWQMDHAQEMQQLEKDSTAALKALKEAAAKHGMTDLDLGEAGE
jgi:hypothetical protein